MTHKAYGRLPVGKGQAAAGFSAGRIPGAAAMTGFAAAGITAGFAMEAFFFAGFLAAFLAAFFAAFFAGFFFATFLAAFLAAFFAGFFAAFFAAGFLAAFLAAGFFAAFFIAGFLAVGFFAAGFFAVAIMLLLHEESKKRPTKKPVCTSPDYSSAQALLRYLALMNPLSASATAKRTGANHAPAKKNAGAQSRPAFFLEAMRHFTSAFRWHTCCGGTAPSSTLTGAWVKTASRKLRLWSCIQSLTRR